MRRSCFFFFLGLVCLAPGKIPGQTITPSNPDAISLSGTKLTEALSQFEGAISTLSVWLTRSAIELQKNQTEIETLEKRADTLRESSNKNSNIFDEIRLKSLLNDLKGKLDQQSDLQHQWDNHLSDFQQKGLSLVALYNDEIEADLEKNDPGDSSGLGSEVDQLVLVVQKRNHVKALLRQYQINPSSDKSEPTSDLGSLSGADRENLQLALDLLQDRKKELLARVDKSLLEEGEIQNELKLQEKMQDFLEDIQRLNEDGDLPKGSLKRNDLEGVAGKGEKTRLESRLGETLDNEKLDRERLTQTDQMMGKVQDQINSLKAGKK